MTVIDGQMEIYDIPGVRNRPENSCCPKAKDESEKQQKEVDMVFVCPGQLECFHHLEQSKK